MSRASDRAGLALPCICLATKRGRTIRSPMLAAGTRFGPYEILEPLGSGGMGDVYRARDADLRREVALKVLPPSMASDVDRLARLHREARVLAALNHPHTARSMASREAPALRHWCSNLWMVPRVLPESHVVPCHSAKL